MMDTYTSSPCGRRDTKFSQSAIYVSTLQVFGVQVLSGKKNHKREKKKELTS